MELPLARLRVLDLTEGDAQYCGRYLADLGAQVVLVEPRRIRDRAPQTSSTNS